MQPAATACLMGIQILNQIIRDYHRTIFRGKFTVWTTCAKLHAALRKSNRYTTAHQQINEEYKIMQTIRNEMQQLHIPKVEKEQPNANQIASKKKSKK